jgi:hypothetical protein
MTFLLSSQNVFDYLFRHDLCTQEDRYTSNPELKTAKNFNLLINLQNKRQLLIKQERLNREGKTKGEFLNEWRNHELFQQFAELDSIRASLSEVVHFDTENSIVVFNYLSNYRDLADFYGRINNFPVEVATEIGKLIATIHRLTLNHQKYRELLTQNRDRSAILDTRSLKRIEPDIFGTVPADGLKFFALYQRYDSLGRAIAELFDALQPCCLIHNDLKLNNILLHDDWEQFSPDDSNFKEVKGERLIRLIDWERGSWGDPAFDIGTIVASYLRIWLSSLVIGKEIEIEKALSLAITPLESIQPSIAALAVAYFDSFPQIVEYRPDFLQRVVQFAGLALIQQIQAMIQYQKSFGNGGICMLQVAKSLLCRPEQLILTVFGASSIELIRRDRFSV